LAHKEVPEGCKAVFRKSNTIQVDIDSPTIPDSLRTGIKAVNDFFPVEEVFSWRSKSGNNHVEVRLKSSISDQTAIALQLYLGSDPIRELISIARAQGGVTPASLLHKPDSSLSQEIPLT
jgi:hypothetical protein